MWAAESFNLVTSSALETILMWAAEGFNLVTSSALETILMWARLLKVLIYFIFVLGRKTKSEIQSIKNFRK